VLSKINSPNIERLANSRSIFLIAVSTVVSILALFYFSIFALRNVIQQKDEVALDYSQRLLDVERLFLAAEKQVSSSRGFLLFRNPQMLTQVEEARKEFDFYIEELMKEVKTGRGEQYLNDIIAINIEYQKQVNEILAQRQQNDLAAIEKYFVQDLGPKREQMYQLLEDFEVYKRNLLEKRRAESVSAATRSWRFSLMMGILATLIIPSLAWLLYHAIIRHQEALAAVKMRQDVLASVSHDLKNPLGTIILGANMLERKAPDNESGQQVKHLAERMRKSGESMNALIEDLLNLARIEAGNLTLKRDPIDPHLLTREAYEMLQTLAASKGIQVQLKDELGVTNLQGDYQKLLRVFSNLIGNAVKFTPPGGQIKILAQQWHDHQLIFSVIDSGPGIPAEELTTIFERFWQAKHTAHQGTGLGLSICKGIIEAHGGKIWAETQQKQGATFCFTLPLMHQSA
jgi:signal transduction histidine kinase